MADRCRSCRAEVVWTVTTSGRRMPVEAAERGNVVLGREGEALVARVVDDGQGTHVSHFATCPQANSWRRERQPTLDLGGPG